MGIDIDIYSERVYNLRCTHFKYARKIMSRKIDEMLEKAIDYCRVRELAYFCRHRELLKDKHYNCAYRLLRIAHIKKYAFMTVEQAVRCAEMDIEDILKSYESEEVEKYKVDIDYLADLSKRFDIADKLDKLGLIEY